MNQKKSSSAKETTSWGGVADWYDAHLEQDEDSYHQKVLLPNLLRVLSIQKGEQVLDLACGQGFFSRALSDVGAKVTAVDISPELIGKAREHTPAGINFLVTSADQLTFAKDDTYDAVVCVLAIQNIEHMTETFKEVIRVLKPRGRFILVVNHPAFRIPKRSAWGWDEEAKVQYRRVDGYLSQARIQIDMNPSKSNSEKTISYHRSLQDFMKALAGAGFVATRLEEWISHRQSQVGPRQKAEDIARKEIPLFLMLEARPSSNE